MAEEGARPPHARPPLTRASYDDLPYAPQDLPPEIRAPLAPYGGDRPPAPDWFEIAIAEPPQRGFVATPRGRIETLTWGEVGKPGLLFVHGNSAHADWWSFIAPFFAQDYRVAAMSLAGMGQSDWRARYSFVDFAEDAEAVARATGLYDGGRKPLYVGHSFGGGQVFFVAATHPDRLSGAIVVDAGFGAPPPQIAEERQKRLEAIRQLPPEQRPNRIYADLPTALARFRLAPPQPTSNHFIVDYIARHSLRQVPRPDAPGEGWTWKFDPDMWEKLDREVMTEFFGAPRPVSAPIAHLYGQHSRVPERIKAGEPTPFPAEGLLVEIPDSYHHVMIDQPLGLVSAIRTLLAAWRL